jgi:hypothetical protein
VAQEEEAVAEVVNGLGVVVVTEGVIKKGSWDEAGFDETPGVAREEEEEEAVAGVLNRLPSSKDSLEVVRIGQGTGTRSGFPRAIFA